MAVQTNPGITQQDLDVMLQWVAGEVLRRLHCRLRVAIANEIDAA